MEPAKLNTVRWWLERIADNTIRDNAFIALNSSNTDLNMGNLRATSLEVAIMTIPWNTPGLPGNYWPDIYHMTEDKEIKVLSQSEYTQSVDRGERATFNPCREMLVIPNGKWAIKGPIHKDEAILNFFLKHSINYLSGTSNGHYSFDSSRGAGNESRTYGTNELIPSDFTIITKEEWHEMYDGKPTIIDEIRNKIHVVGNTLYSPHGLPEIWIIAAPIRDTAIELFLKYYSPKLDTNRSTGYYVFNSIVKSGGWHEYPGSYKPITLNDFLKAQQSQVLKPQNSHEHKQINGTTVKTSRPTPTVTRGPRSLGSPISGKAGRATVVLGHLSNRKVIGL